MWRVRASLRNRDEGGRTRWMISRSMRSVLAYLDATRIFVKRHPPLDAEAVESGHEGAVPKLLTSTAPPSAPLTSKVPSTCATALIRSIL